MTPAELERARYLLAETVKYKEILNGALMKVEVMFIAGPTSLEQGLKEYSIDIDGDLVIMLRDFLRKRIDEYEKEFEEL